MARVTEAKIANVIEQILAGWPNGEGRIRDLIAEIPIRIALSEADLAQSLTRPNEAVWEQLVRNITSHKNSTKNAIYEGRLVAIPGGFRLPRRAA